jgi:cobyrinic acid a,c-diamide synthase
MARTAGAVVLGMKRFDPDLCLAGVILNRVSGPSHADYLRPSIEETAGAPVLGWLPATPDVAIPSRHLGLLSAGEVGGDAYESLAHLAEGGLDLDRLLLIARAAPPLDAAGWPAPPTVSGANGGGSPVRIAVARDEAFQFYYAENLRLLQALGAEICFFSPLADDPLPPDVGLVYLGGGYPELHAERLAGCSTTQQGLRQFASSGGPVYAECGGLQYLGRRLMTLEGTAYPMVGLLPLTTTMERRIVALGYSEVVATGQHPFLPAGARIRVHEFHYSSLQLEEPVPAAYRLEKQGRKPRPDGFVRGKVLASYAHAHFGGAPELAEGLIHAARLYKPGCARGQHPTPYDGKE